MNETRRIDLKHVLQQAVATRHGDLVTRRTGQAVRDGIEALLQAIDAGDVAVIDFGTVRCLDLSCADEIVGKLLLRWGRVRSFVLVGLDPSHRDAIEPVLERHRLAAVAQDQTGRLHLLGELPRTAREAFEVLADAGGAGAREIAERLEAPLEHIEAALEELTARRLVREEGAVYQPLRCA